MQYIVLGDCANYLAVIEMETYSGPCQTSKIERFAKRIIPKIIQDRGGFVKLGHFDKHFVKNTKKGKHF